MCFDTYSSDVLYYTPFPHILIPYKFKVDEIYTTDIEVYNNTNLHTKIIVDYELRIFKCAKVLLSKYVFRVNRVNPSVMSSTSR